jgi:hypothetical protein
MNQKLHYQQRLVQMDNGILHSCADDAKNTMYCDNIKPSFFFKSVLEHHITDENFHSFLTSALLF